MSNTAQNDVLFSRNWSEIKKNHEVIFMNTKQTDGHNRTSTWRQ